MANTGIRTGDKAERNFSKLKTYSVDEILAAGGPEAFATKLNKNPQNIPEKLKQFDKEDFLTEEEFQAALKMLRENK